MNYIPFFDEEIIVLEQMEFVIPLCDRDASIVAIVDEIDWLWARKWSWNWQMSKPRSGNFKKKFYARRSTRVKGANVKLYLHKEIMLRTGIKPPCERHTIVDRINGNSMDCRRENLRWATPKMNRANIVR